MESIVDVDEIALAAIDCREVRIDGCGVEGNVARDSEFICLLVVFECAFLNAVDSGSSQEAVAVCARERVGVGAVAACRDSIHTGDIGVRQNLAADVDSQLVARRTRLERQNAAVHQGLGVEGVHALERDGLNGAVVFSFGNGDCGIECVVVPSLTRSCSRSQEHAAAQGEIIRLLIVGERLERVVVIEAVLVDRANARVDFAVRRDVDCVELVRGRDFVEAVHCHDSVFRVAARERNRLTLSQISSIESRRTNRDALVGIIAVEVAADDRINCAFVEGSRARQCERLGEVVVGDAQTVVVECIT